jgi:hypothetical protein
VFSYQIIFLTFLPLLWGKRAGNLSTLVISGLTEKGGMS